MSSADQTTTAARVIGLAGLSAAMAGLLFVAIQPIHPPETLASVTTSTWVLVHYTTLAMVRSSSSASQASTPGR